MDVISSVIFFSSVMVLGLLAYPILQITQKKETWGPEIRAVWDPLKISLQTDDALSKVFFQPFSGHIGSMRACSVLLEPERTDEERT